MEKSESTQWVMDQIDALAPPAGWEPDPAIGLSRLHAPEAAPPLRPAWRGWPVWTAAALAMAALVLAIPGSRLAAQRLWQLLTVGRLAVVQVGAWPEGVPSPAIKPVGLPLPPIPARDAEEAARRVGYQPRLPGPFVLSAPPKLSTTFSVGAATTVHAEHLRLALEKSGVHDLSVPPEWDGARLELRTGGLVIAEWPDIVLVQSLPLTLTAPNGFDVEAFWATILRILGIDAAQARRLAQEAGTSPLWLVPLSRDFTMRRGALEEVQLNSGRGLLLIEQGPNAQTTLYWTDSGRVFLLHGKLTRQLALAVANGVE